jgi:membrane protease YdiL (CAAX protease family)
VPPPRISGWRVAATLGLWAVLAAVVAGGTLLAVRFGFPGVLAAHRAAVGAVLVVEAYATLLAALLIAFGGWRGVRDQLGFRFTAFRHLGLALVAWITALIVGVAATALLSPLLGPPRSNATDLLGRSFDPLFVALIVPTVCILAPICEELLFRGAIFGWLRSRLPVPVAAVISAAVFAGAHLLLPLFPELFVFGLAAALVYQRTGSTLNSFVMHATQNTTAVLIAYAVLTRRLAG